MNGRIIIQNLKNALKEKNITYKDLAARLQITEAGIKKQFQSADISFNRLQLICDLLGLSLSTILEQSQSKLRTDLTFSEEQKSYFLKNPGRFAFYQKLNLANGDFKAANSFFELKPEVLEQLKADFSQMNLWGRSHEDQKLVQNLFGSVSQDDFFRKQITELLFKRLLENSVAGDELFFDLLRLSPTHAEDLKKDLERVYQIYLRKSDLNARAKDGASKYKLYSIGYVVREFSFAPLT